MMNEKEPDFYREIYHLLHNKMNNGVDGEEVCIVAIMAIRTFVHIHANDPIKSINYLRKELMRRHD